MSTSWKQLWCRVLILLVHVKGICTKTPSSTPTQLAPTTSLQTDVRRVVLKGDSQSEVIQVWNPLNLTLLCLWAGNPNQAPTVSGVWRKDGADIGSSRQMVPMENQQFRLERVFHIQNEKALGIYSCVFGENATQDFLVKGPQIEEARDKPIVSYVGDYVVIECKLDDSKPKPNGWTWFRQNDTEKEQIPVAGRYKVKNEGRKTRLQVHNLTEDDSGYYHCGANYAIQIATSRVELKVITFYEPLKPFIAIIVEVIILVAVILLYERSQSGKKTETAAVALNATPSAEQSKAATSADGDMDGSSVRRRGNTDEA
ncbi:embigin-like [Neosynchiropus ocellatus]